MGKGEISKKNIIEAFLGNVLPSILLEFNCGAVFSVVAVEVFLRVFAFALVFFFCFLHTVPSFLRCRPSLRIQSVTQSLSCGT